LPRENTFHLEGGAKRRLLCEKGKGGGGSFSTEGKDSRKADARQTTTAKQKKAIYIDRAKEKDRKEAERWEKEEMNARKPNTHALSRPNADP
jgi:hypothetical protein